jgi:hypothetical protein
MLDPLPSVTTPQKSFQEMLESPKFIYSTPNENLSELSKTSHPILKSNPHLQKKACKGEGECI